MQDLARTEVATSSYSVLAIFFTINLFFACDSEASEHPIKVSRS